MANQTFSIPSEPEPSANPFLELRDDSLARFRRRTATPRAALPWSSEPDGYTMVQSMPALRSDDVELAGVEAVEVVILWGDTVLEVAHLTPPRNYYVGEAQGAPGFVDFLIPAEQLGGATRAPVVLVEAGAIRVVVPDGARGLVESEGRAVEVDAARGTPCAELAGARCVRLEPGARARVELGDLTLSVGVVPAGKPTARDRKMDKGMLGAFALSLLTTAGLVGAMAAFVPPLGLTPDDGADPHRLYVLQQYLDSSAEKDNEAREIPNTEQGGESEGGTGERSSGEEGEVGKDTAARTNDHYAVKKTSDDPPALTRQEAIKLAQEFGTIGLLHQAFGDPDALSAPWGADRANGHHDRNVVGAMFGDDVGENWGMNGLGLTGIGEGGGSRGEGIGLGDIGGLGQGAGLGRGQGIGNGVGRLSGGRASKGAPRMRPGVTTTSGRLPPEVIQRIVRQNFGRFRMCYERGLTSNPNLEGRVSVRFVIGRDGAVSNVSNGGSDLPDAGVVSCVVSSFYSLSFPAPDNGVVTVVYPLSLSPG